MGIIRKTAAPAALSLSFALFATSSQAATLGFSVGAPDSARSSSELELFSWFHLPRDRDTGLKVEVLDDETLQPIAGAQVRVSDSVSARWVAEDLSSAWDATGSEELSDESGLTAFSADPSIAGEPAKTVTVLKDGYAAVTLIGVTSSKATIYLKRRISQSPAPVIVSGTMGDYQVPANRELVRAGLIFRSLSVHDLLDFQVSSFISPIKDTINVWGKREIPSNIVLPEQRVSLGFVSATLNKPQYRIPLTTQRPTILVGLQGEMASRDLMDAVSGSGDKTDPALLNKASLTKIGLSASFTARPDQKLDLPANLDLVPTIQVAATRPPYDAKVSMVAVSDLNGDRETLIPTDVKTDAPNNLLLGTVSLKSTRQALGKSVSVVAVALGDKGKRLSGVVMGVTGGSARTGEFLPTDSLPDFGQVPASVPIRASSQGIGAAIFEAPLNSSNELMPKTEPVWFVYTLPAAGQVNIPTSKSPISARFGSYSVLQLDLGSSFNEKQIDGRTALRGLERFTRSEANQQQ